MNRAERVPQYRGDLRQTALPEMLAIIDRTRVAGRVEAVWGDQSKRIFLDDGYVVHASSSVLDDGLGDFLKRVGRLSEDQYVAAMQQRKEGSSRLGELLIVLGFLSPAEVYQAIREQVEAILWSLFSWEEGEVTFSIGTPELAGIVRIQIPLRQVIVQGVKRAANARTIVQRMGGRESIFEPSYRGEDLIEIALDAQEYGLLASVDRRRSLYQLCTDGPVAAAEAARLLYAFSVLGLIRRVDSTPPVERPVNRGIKIKLRSDR